MADIFDRASALEQQERDASIARRQEVAAAHDTPFEIEGVRVCADCFEPISKHRLEALPTAVRCIDCQELRERRLRGANGL